MDVPDRELHHLSEGNTGEADGEVAVEAQLGPGEGDQAHREGDDEQASQGDGLGGAPGGANSAYLGLIEARALTHLLVGNSESRG